MSLNSRARSRVLGAAACGLALLLSAGTQALAQASGCDALGGQLEQRKAIGARLSASGKKQIDAKVACSGFTQLVQNGTSLIKWAETNKDWCQIPASFIDSIKQDHGRAQAIRTKACTFAARQAEAEKNGGGAGSGLLGGGGLTGLSAMPKGAL